MMDCDDAVLEAPASFTSLINNQSSLKAMVNGMSESSSTAAATVVQFKLYNSPVTFWKRRFRDRPFTYKVSPMDMSRRDSEALLDHYEGQESSNINDLLSENTAIKISVMKDGQCKPRPQDQFGHKYDVDEFVMLSTNIVDSERMVFKESEQQLRLLAYMIDFYVNDTALNLPVPEHIGFCYILPSNLRGTSGSCTMPITGKKHQPIGQIAIEYLIVRPLAGYEPGEMNFGRQWKPTIKGMDIGHRGAGFARRTDKVENVLENTVASFNYAAAHGADMVELDVQLTKDMVPVIYHDFFVNIAMRKKKSTLEEHEFVQIPVKDLTHAQLQALKLSPVHKQGKEQYDFLDDDNPDNQPFQTLEHILDAVDPRCGFNVEIKYPLQRHDGSFDGCNASGGNFADLNDYCDIILRVVMEHAKNREIIFSCFHPDVCTMISLKQTKYPLLFLTQGMTEKWDKYWDPRTRDVQGATYFAQAIAILGVNAHAEDILKDRSLIQFVKQRDLCLFVWGEDLMSRTVIKQLKDDGLDGVIYDKIDEFHSKEPSFIMGSSSERKALINILTSADSSVQLGSSWASSNVSTNSSP